MSQEITKNVTKNVYDNLSVFYDKIFFLLVPGHKKAGAYIKEANIKNVLEVGIGTGLTLPHYAPGVKIMGVDMSSQMLKGAHKRLPDFPELDVELKEMDAQELTFDDNSFSCTYAPSLMTVVPDPKKLLKEMIRVTKPGGKVIVISHFEGKRMQDKLFSKAAAPLTKRLFGFRMDLKLDIFDQAEGAHVVLKRKVNPAGPYCLSHMVVLEKEAQAEVSS
jgi:phosphatidylethanolamine/phosphatidyl-N-methylethanolamine N-methyltransferase